MSESRSLVIEGGRYEVKRDRGCTTAVARLVNRSVIAPRSPEIMERRDEKREIREGRRFQRDRKRSAPAFTRVFSIEVAVDIDALWDLGAVTEAVIKAGSCS